MQINSIEFLMYFLPVFLLAYYMTPRAGRNWILILGSLIFYGFNCSDSLWMLGLLAGTSVWTYGMAALLIRYPRRWLLAANLILMAILLCFFKLYADGRYLPVGLSFYLFQQAAFLVDVVKNRWSEAPGLGVGMASITMFPKLLSGPICDNETLMGQLSNRKFSAKRMHRGLHQLILGLAMKVLLADPLAGLWSEATVIGYESVSTGFAWMALVAYALRLYLDFWGYSLMAMGVGRMLGLELPENFNHPYASRSVSEFYRRWHITLGAWFRKYIYIPLGGSRKGLWRTLLNLAVVWAFTGFWHGTGGNYLLWAGFLLFFIMMERLWLGKCLNKLPVLSHFYTVLVILLSWIPFAIGDFSRLTCFVERLVGAGGPAANPADVWIIGGEFLPALLAGLLLATPFPDKLWKKLHSSPVSDILVFILFWIVIYALATGDQSPFMYYQF